MSDKDDLAREIYLSDFWANPVAAANDWDSGIAPVREVEQAAHVARALWADGWRKKPSREQVAHALSGAEGLGGVFGPQEKHWNQADAILALMDGGSDE